MAIYTAVKCPNFSTGYSDSASKATTKTVPKTVRNGLYIDKRNNTLSRIRRGLVNASYLAIGNVVTQIIVLVGFIYIARRLGTENYGVYASVGVFVTMFTMFTFSGLGKVIIREGSKNLSSLESLYNKVIGVRLLFLVAAMALCVLCVFLTPYDHQTRFFIVLFSFQIFFEGMTSFFSTIYQVVEKMQYISIINIVSRTFFVLLAAGVLYAGYGVLALIVIALIVNAATLVWNYCLTRRFVKFNLFSKVRFEKELLKPAFSFSLFGVVSILSSRFDLFLISILGTPVEVGIYAVAYKLALQGQMLRNVNAMAFFPIFVKRFQEGKVCGAKMVKYALGFFFVILAASVIVSYFCTDIVTFVLGEEYKESGKVLSVLIFYLAALWGTLPFTIAAQATHNENLMLKIGTVMALLNVVFKYVSFNLYGLIGVAYCTVLIWSVGSVAMCVFPYRAMRKQGYLKQTFVRE